MCDTSLNHSRYEFVLQDEMAVLRVMNFAPGSGRYASIIEGGYTGIALVRRSGFFLGVIFWE